MGSGGGNPDPVHARQLQIEDRHLGVQLADQPQGLGSIAGLGDQFELGALLDVAGESVAKQWMVIGDQHPGASVRGHDPGF